MPSVGAFVQGYYGNPGFDMFDAMLNNRWTLNVMAGLKVSWNIGGLYHKKNDLAKIGVEQQILDAERDRFRFDTKLRVSQQETLIASKRKELAQNDEIIRLRKEVRKSSEAKLQNGIIVVNDLIRDITQENQAQISRSAHELELLLNIS